jgi:hypothetical protein
MLGCGKGRLGGTSGSWPEEVDGDEDSEAIPVPLWALESLRLGSG